jgi:S-adenosylmethionine hydrolase
MTPALTLLTDFGVSDTYVGQMKGVIATIAPNTTVIDLTHDVPAQDVLAGAVELDGALDAFAAGTIHVGVVDPGVGSLRQPIAVRTDRFTFVGPDNGLVTAALDQADTYQAVALTNRAYHRSHVSATFHGRDIFAPAAAHLANGASLEMLGEPIERPQRLDLPQPRADADQLSGEVLLIDRFGNLITNITRDDLRHHGWLDAADRSPSLRVDMGVTTIEDLSQTFSDAAVGGAVAYIGSSGRLEIAVRDGNAARTLGMRRGDAVKLMPPVG